MSIGLLVDMAFWAFKTVIRFFFPLCTATGIMHKKKKKPKPSTLTSNLYLQFDVVYSVSNSKNSKRQLCFFLFFSSIVNSMNVCFMMSSKLRS